VKKGHIHLYVAYPPVRPRDLIGCLQQEGVHLDVGDSVEYEGKLFTALPCWRGNELAVQVDLTGAQVATITQLEPSRDELTTSEDLVTHG
jgi:hypothetical protein